MATHFNILAGKFHGQRSLVGYCPWDRKESDTTERLSMQTRIFSILQCPRRSHCRGDFHTSFTHRHLLGSRGVAGTALNYWSTAAGK